MKRFIEKFRFDIPECQMEKMEQYYQKASKEYVMRDREIFSFEKYDIFDELLDVIIKLRDEALKERDNHLYCYLLLEVLKNDDLILMNYISMPCRDAHDPIYDTLPLFSLLDLVPGMVSELKKSRGSIRNHTRHLQNV